MSFFGTDASAFVNTAIRRKAVEVSYSRLTEQETIEVDDAKNRELAEWIQVEAMRKVSWRPRDTRITTHANAMGNDVETIR